MERISFIISTILILLFCSVVECYSGELVKDLNVTPTVTIQEIYNSNIFKLKGEKEVRALFDDTKMDDFITFYSAGLKFDGSISNNNLSISGKKDYAQYAHYQDLNYENETLNGKARLNFGTGFFVDPLYGYQDKAIPRIYNVKDEQDFLKYNNAKIDTGYQAVMWKLLGTLQKEDYDYDLEDFLDRKVDTYGGSFTLIFPYSTWYLKYIRQDFKFFDTPVENNNQVDDILFGASLLTNGKNMLMFEGGQHKKNFFSADEKDLESFIGMFSLLYQVSPDTDISLKLSRKTETSYYANTTYYEGNTIMGGLSWKISNNTNTNFLAGHDWLSFKGLTGTRPLEWQRLLTLEFKLNYLPHDNITCHLSYQFQQRDSNLEEIEFIANQAIVGLSISWK